MTSTDLVVRDPGALEVDPWLAELEVAKQAIQAAETIGDLRGISAVADAGKAYARARKSREMAALACEVGLRAERKAGQILLKIGLINGKRPGGEHRDETPYRRALAELDINSGEASKWQRLARIPDAAFEEALRDLKARGKEINHRTLHYVIEREAVPIEIGIDRLSDGCFRIEWREEGTRHTRKCYGMNLDQARERLEKIKIRVRKETQLRARKGDVDEAYALLRKSVNALDQAKDKATGRLAAQIDRAMAAVHQAEDEIQAALKIQRGQQR